MTEESQPGRPTGVRLGLVMSGQDTPNDVFIDGEAERQSNLLSDSRAAPGGIALLGGENRVIEFFAGSVSSEGWHVQWELVPPRQESGAL